MFLMIGTMIIGYTGCSLARVGLLAKGLCKSVFGLGFNSAYVYMDNKKLEESYHSHFSRLYNQHRLRDLAEAE